MMNAISRTGIAATAVALVVALPAGAARDAQRIDPMTLPSSTVHTGAATYSDQQLASDVVSAISADPTLSGATITVVVKDGGITLSGSAKDLSQAARAEKIANDISGGRPVAGKLDIQGG
jgi:osmotically-inducible protein OsmY